MLRTARGLYAWRRKGNGVETRHVKAQLSRRRVLKLTAAGAVGIGLGGLTTSAASAHSLGFQAPRLQANTITMLVNSGDGLRVRAVTESYTSKTGTAVDVLELPYAQSFQKLQIALSQGSDAYDVASLDDPWIPQFAGGHFLANLDEMYLNAGMPVNDQFQPQLLSLGAFPAGEGLRAVPWLGNVQVFAWRKDLISNRPNTWDEVVTTARAIKAAGNGVYGYAIRGAAGNPATTSFLPITRGFGKDVLSPTFEPQLATEEGLAALTTSLKLVETAPPGAENVQHPDVGRFMYTGVTAMSGDIWPDQLLLMFDPSISNVVGLIEIGPEPAQPGVHPANMTGTWLLGIPQGSKNKERAFDFITWFTGYDQQKRLLLEFNNPPTLSPLFGDPEAVAKFPFLPGLLAAAQQAVPRPRTPFYSGVEDIIGRYISQAIAGQTPPAEAVIQSNRDVRDYLVRNGALA